MKIEHWRAGGGNPKGARKILDALEAIPMATLTSAIGLQSPRGG